MAKNIFGTRSVPVVPRDLLGTKQYPLMVFRGEKDERDDWFATFAGLPGYLGVGFNEFEAIQQLKEYIRSKPVIYDVSGSHNIEPTPENIRAFLARRTRAHDAAERSKGASQPRKHGAIKTAAIEFEARKEGISKHEVKAALERQQRWQQLGGLEHHIASFGPKVEQQARTVMRDADAFQAWLENCPERARFLLAKAKIPQRSS